MIHVRGKDMLFIEAHGHVWEKLHGRRFDTETVVPVGNGRVRIGDEVCPSGDDGLQLSDRSTADL